MNVNIEFRVCWNCETHTCQIVIDEKDNKQITKCTLCGAHNFYKIADGKAALSCD